MNSHRGLDDIFPNFIPIFFKKFFLRLIPHTFSPAHYSPAGSYSSLSWGMFNQHFYDALFFAPSSGTFTGYFP